METVAKTRIIKSSNAILPVLGSILILFESAAHAKFDGFYAGGSMGYLQQNTSVDAKQDPTDPKADMHTATAGHGLPTAELFLGWGRVFGGCFYGGVEGKLDLVMGGSKKVAEDTGFIFMSGRKGPGVAVLARLGYLISPQTMIYGGVGVKAVNFVHNIFEKVDKISAPFSKKSVHLLTEVGIETSSCAMQNLAFRFSYSFMPKADMVQKSTSFPVNHMYRENGVFKTGVTEHAVKAGIIYRF